MASTTPSTFVEGNPGDLITDEIIREEIINLYGTWLRFDKLSEDIRNNINDQHILYVLNHNLVDSQRSQIIPSQKAGWIYLSGCIEITDQSLINIANKCPLLITLLIDGCVKITATGIAAITEKFGAKLVTLHYSGCVNCGNVAFESIVMQCTQLKVLEARNTGITVIPEMIGEKLPKLLTLDLSNNNIKRVPPSISQLLNRLPKPRVNIDTKSLENIPSFANKLQLKNTFQNGPGPTCGFLGQTQKGWGPEMWGITLHQIEEVLNYPLIHSKTLMRDVVRLAIKPATKQCQVGYALLLNQDKPLHANVMVSHAWDEPIGDFIRCLRRSGKKGPFWVCAFSIYQNHGEDDHPTIGEQLGSDPEYGPFATVLKGANSMIAVLTEVSDIYTRLWCVYELFMAQKLNVDVQLYAQMDSGAARNDICVKNIGNAVDSENAICSWEPDKVSIHEAIQKNQTQNGFNGINKAVERIRLDYLLKHKVIDYEYEIKDMSEETGRYYPLRYLFFLVPLFIIGMVAYPFGYHFCFLMLPLVGLILDIFVMFIGNEALISKWKRFMAKWMRFIATLGIMMFFFVVHFFKFDRDYKRRDVKSLVDTIIMMVERIYLIGDDVPSFKDYCESSKTWSFLYEWAPIFVFKCWRKEVERLIQQRDGSVVENTAVNELTPLNII